MYMFILYVLLIYIISNGIGKKVLKKNSKLYGIRSLIGFVCFLGVLQLLYYPMQYFHVSGNYSFIITLIIFVVSLIYGIKNLKKEDFDFLKDYRFWLMLIFFFGIMKITPSIDATDDEFYFPFIIDNAYNKINTISPESGSLGNIDPYHAYQGYYLFVSFIYRIQHSIFNSITDIFISFRTTFTLLFTIYFSILLKFIKEKLDKKINKYIYFIIEALAVLLVGIAHLNHIYFGSFSLFGIYISVLMIIYDTYLKEKDKNFMIMTLMTEFGIISLASSSLFLILILLSTLFSYEVILNKRVNITDYFLLAIPTFVYIGFIFNIIYILLLIPIFLLIIKKYEKTLNKYFSLYGKYIVYLVFCVFVIVSPFIGSIINLKLFSKLILLFNTFMLLILAYCIFIKKKKYDFIIFCYMITIILFYNPFTANFVSRFLTTEDVFYRISFITKSPLAIITILVYVLFVFKDKKIYKYGLSLFVIALAIMYARNIYTLMMKNEDYKYKYNYILREIYENLDLGEKVSKLSGNILSLDYSARIYNSDLKVNLYRFLGTNPSKEILYEVLYHNEEINQEFLDESKKYDYIISQNKYNDSLQEYYDCIYSNKVYSLYKVN